MNSLLMIGGWNYTIWIPIPNINQQFEKENYMSDGLKSYGENCKHEGNLIFFRRCYKKNDVLTSQRKRGTSFCI